MEALRSVRNSLALLCFKAEMESDTRLLEDRMITLAASNGSAGKMSCLLGNDSAYGALVTRVLESLEPSACAWPSGLARYTCLHVHVHVYICLHFHMPSWLGLCYLVSAAWPLRTGMYSSPIDRRRLEPRPWEAWGGWRGE